VYAAEFARLVPNSRTEIVDKAAHMAPMEQPAAVAALVRDFIKK
jgi:pimeloyl-ACP methyl ester carboxylesterase